jgi:hypothetical protein
MHEAGELLSDQRFRLSVHTYEIASRGMRDLPRVPVAGGASTDGGVPARLVPRANGIFDAEFAEAGRDRRGRMGNRASREAHTQIHLRALRSSANSAVASPLSSGTDRTGMCTSGPSAAILGFVS